jgi:hypothetical protein
MGNDNHVVASHKLCGFQGRVGGRIVVMKEPVVVAPMFQSFLLHIFLQRSQNFAVKVRLDRSVRRNKFTTDNPFTLKKKTMSMLFVELQTCLSFFVLDDCALFH